MDYVFKVKRNCKIRFSDDIVVLVDCRRVSSWGFASEYPLDNFEWDDKDRVYRYKGRETIYLECIRFR